MFHIFKKIYVLFQFGFNGRQNRNYCASYHFSLQWIMSYSVFPTNDDFFIGHLFPFVSYFHPYLDLFLSPYIAKSVSLWSKRLPIMQTACLTHSCTHFLCVLSPNYHESICHMNKKYARKSECVWRYRFKFVMLFACASKPLILVSSAIE